MPRPSARREPEVDRRIGHRVDVAADRGDATQVRGNRLAKVAQGIAHGDEIRRASVEFLLADDDAHRGRGHEAEDHEDEHHLREREAAPARRHRQHGSIV